MLTLKEILEDVAELAKRNEGAKSASQGGPEQGPREIPATLPKNDKDIVETFALMKEVAVEDGKKLNESDARLEDIQASLAECKELLKELKSYIEPP